MKNFILLFRANMRLGDFVYGQRSKEKAAGKKLGTAALVTYMLKYHLIIQENKLKDLK